MLSYPVELLENKTKGFLMVITTKKGKIYEIELEEDNPNSYKIYNIVKDLPALFKTGFKFLAMEIPAEDLKEISVELI